MKKFFCYFLTALCLLSSACAPQVPEEVVPMSTPTPIPTPAALVEMPAGDPMLAEGEWHVLGLCKDGTVLSAGNNLHGQCDVQTWESIVWISANADTSAGLKADGTIALAGAQSEALKDALSWKDVASVSLGEKHIVALTTDGTVLCAGDNTQGQCDLAQKTDIVAVEAVGNSTIITAKDGTVTESGAVITTPAPGTDTFTAQLSPDGSVAIQSEYADFANLTANWNLLTSSAKNPPAAVDPNAEKLAEAKGINDDVLGWINVPNTNIDMAILYGDDYYYNNHDINKKKSNAGTAYTYHPDDNKVNTVTAHNMRVSGTMFHELHHVQDSGEALLSYPNRIVNMTLFGHTRWEIFALYEVKKNEPVDTLLYNSNLYKEINDDNIGIWIDHQIGRSEIELPCKPTADDTFVTLITCGDNHDSDTAQSRLYIFLKAVD